MKAYSRCFALTRRAHLGLSSLNRDLPVNRESLTRDYPNRESLNRDLQNREFINRDTPNRDPLNWSPTPIQTPGCDRSALHPSIEKTNHTNWLLTFFVVANKLFY